MLLSPVYGESHRECAEQAGVRASDLSAVSARGAAGERRILDEFCQVTRSHRKHAIRLLNGPAPGAARAPQRRARTYSPAVIEALRTIWEAAGYPWSLRLKHDIPLKTDRWAVATPRLHRDRSGRPLRQPGGGRVRALAQPDGHPHHLGRDHRRPAEEPGRGAAGARGAPRGVALSPRGIDSDNGSEFINQHLWDYYCQAQQIQFTRGRPDKKDDDAHIEQKNWTHVRKLLGYVRYDTPG
jgi:hypothetical protein